MTQKNLDLANQHLFQMTTDYRNINETSEDLMNLFINCPEIIELDLRNNMLTKLPLEISFLTCLRKLDIRNNAFSNVK